MGTDCDLSLYDVAISLLTYPATWHLTGGWEPARRARSAHPSLVPFQLFQGADGGWFIVACPKEKFWVRLTEVIRRSDLAADARFVDFDARSRNGEDLIALLDQVFASRPAAEWVDDLRTAGVPTGPVQDVGRALVDPHTEARGLVVESQHPRFGTVRQIASPVRVGSPDDITYRRAPMRNEHAEDILERLLGYDQETRSRMQAEGAFGPDT